jgi:tRNA dimethylallyltransferase
MGKPAEGTRVLAIVGPTGVGKTLMAVDIARELDAEIVSVDSMQIYRGMDIGTAKPDEKERAKAVFHLLDIADVTKDFSVADFKTAADEAIAEIDSRGKTPLLVGGSGLYYRAVVDDLDFSNASDPYREETSEELEEMSDDELHLILASVDPSAAAEIPAANRRRVLRAIDVARVGDRLISERQHSWADFTSPYELRVAGLEMERHVLYGLIDMRVDWMMQRGLEKEVLGLVEAGLKAGTTAGEALGYRQMLDYLDGDVPLAAAVEETKKRTRNFAKRQLTWFRKDPRIEWFDIPARHGDSPDVVRTRMGATSRKVLEYLRQTD